MEYYVEYPIRCKTCNSQIACFAAEYNALLVAGYTIQQALDHLEIMNYCCRIYMKDPVIVMFNMENRDVIEGIKKVENTEDFGVGSIYEKDDTRFGACLVTDLQVEPKAPVKPKAKGIGALAPVELEGAVAVGEGIDLGDIQAPTNFETPTTVGICTINRIPGTKLETKMVGAAKETKILSGRTYLAR